MLGDRLETESAEIDSLKKLTAPEKFVDVARLARTIPQTSSTSSIALSVRAHSIIWNLSIFQSSLHGGIADGSRRTSLGIAVDRRSVHYRPLVLGLRLNPYVSLCL